MSKDGETSGAASATTMELYRCRHNELHKREIGSSRPAAFAHRIGGCEDLIQRLKLYGKLPGHRGRVNTVSFNPSGDRLISGSDDKQIIFWDWMAKRKKFSYDSGHVNNVFQARVMPFTDDRTVISTAVDGQVRVGEVLESGKVETKKLGKHRGPAHKLAIEPGSPRTFLSCGEDGVVQHFDLRDGRSTKLLTCQSFDGRSKTRFPPVRLNAIVINSRNPNHFAVGGSDEYARVYDVRKIDPVEDCPMSYYAPKHLVGFPHLYITCVAYSQQEELLVSYNDELIYLFQKDMDFQELRPDIKSTSDEEDSSDEEQNGSDNENDENDTESGKKMDRVKQDDSKDKRSEDNAGITEDTGGPQVYKGHRNAQTVKGVNFFGPNTEYVVSGSDCGHIFIWRKRGGKLITMLKGDNRVVNYLEPHPHATFLATSGLDKHIKLWAPTAYNLQPLPRDAEEIMERNRRNREDISHISITPEIIMRVLHLQTAYSEGQMQSDQGEDDAYYNALTGENSEDENSDDSLGSPRECIIS